MNGSYKLALLISAVLCIIVVIYYAKQPPVHPEDGLSSVALRNQADPTPTPADEVPISPGPAPFPKIPGIHLDDTNRPPPPEVAEGLGPQPATPSLGPASKTPKTHTIAAGETFGKIARHYFGDEKYWQQISKANPRVDPQKLRVGQIIRLPRLASLDRNSDEPGAAAPTAAIPYKVRPNDTLSSIAKHYYGEASMWRYLYRVNRKKIGSDPGRLRAGMMLDIPPAPREAE